MQIYILGSSSQHGKEATEYIKTGSLDVAPHHYSEGFTQGESQDTSGDRSNNSQDGKVEFVQCNFENLKEVAKVAVDLKDRLDRLDNV